MSNPLPDVLAIRAFEEALQNCASEPIHQVLRIQSAGILLAATETDFQVCAASANLSSLIPCSAEAAIGQPLGHVLGETADRQLRTLTESKEWPGAKLLSLTVWPGGMPVKRDAQVFRSEGLIVLEIELEPAESGDVFHELFLPIRDALWKLDAESDIQRYTRAVVDKVRLLTGYDRVMMYRFDSNWDGEVIAESKNEAGVSYLGSRFPASDIPAQARELYTRNLVRLIADIDEAVVPLVGVGNPLTGQPVSLTHSWLRSLSPVHVEYLRNMGVRASMSISLVQNNRLWGLIACHHFTPKYVSLRSRELNEFIGRVVSLKLINMDNAERTQLNGRIRELLFELTDRIRHASGLDAVIRTFRQDFLGVVRASGAIIAIDNERHELGEVPPQPVVDTILSQLRQRAVSPVFHTDHLAEFLEVTDAQRETASGIMVAPLDHVMEDFVMWFRPGVLRTLRWAGRPEKKVIHENGKPRLSPRESFETWVEIYRDKSLPWSQAEVDAASSLSMALIEVLTQQALESSEESYRLLAENSTDLIARLDLEAHFTFVSPACRELIGAAPAELLGKSVQDIVLAEDIDIFRRVFAELDGLGNNRTTLVRCRRLDGKVIWVEAKLKRMCGLHGLDEIVVNARDVTQRYSYQLAIEELHRRNTRILDSAGEGLVSLDAEGTIIYVNDVAARLLGQEADAVAGRPCCDVLCGLGNAVCPEQNQCPFLMTLADAETRQGVQFLSPLRERRSSQLQYVCTPLVENNAITGCVIVLNETSGSPSSEMSAADVVVAQALEAVMVTDPEGRITSVNRAFSEITGYSADEVIGQTPRILRSGVHTPHFYVDFWRALTERRRWAGEIWNRRKNGEVYPQWGSVTAVLDSVGKLRSYVAVFSDISKAKQAEEKLYHLANHDALTGLPNRMKFNDQLAAALERAKRARSRLAVVFVDLDRFKLVNDTLGHAVGDLYLKQIAERLTQGLRKQDTLARWGGDEFVIILDEIGNRAEINATMERLSQKISQPIVLDSHELLPTASLGISVFPDDGRAPGDLIRAADAAMYRAKDKGRNGHAFYTEGMGREVSEKLSLAGELRRAIQAGELRLYYQPQIDVQSDTIHGVEALVRWQHPTRGFLAPGQFIRLAEELGVIGELGLWVLGEACRQFRDWQKLGLAVPQVAVNVAPTQLKEVFVEQVAAVLDATRVAPACLELEITEGALESSDTARKVTRRLRDLGVQLSIDDFGTGYSSLSHLKRFPVSCFKIDKSFVDGLPDSAEDAAIVHTILALGSSLKVTVVAEGVETAAQVEFLRRAGVNKIQGFYYAKAMPPDALAQFIGAHHPG